MYETLSVSHHESLALCLSVFLSLCALLTCVFPAGDSRRKLTNDETLQLRPHGDFVTGMYISSMQICLPFSSIRPQRAHSSLVVVVSREGREYEGSVAMIDL